MKILKTIKEFLFPKKYNGLEIADMAKNIKFDYYYTETIDLIYSSNKLTDSEKNRMVDNIIHDYSQNKFIDEWIS